MMSKFTNIDAE